MMKLRRKSPNLKSRLRFNLLLFIAFIINIVLISYFYTNTYIDHNEDQRVEATNLINLITEIDHLKLSIKEEKYLKSIIPRFSNNRVMIRIADKPQISSDYIYSHDLQINSQQVNHALSNIRFWRNNIISIYSNQLKEWIIVYLPAISFPWFATAFVLLQLLVMLYLLIYLINGRKLLLAMNRLFELEQRHQLNLPAIRGNFFTQSSLHLLHKSAQYIDSLIAKIQTLNEVKMKTMATLAHDIRTPLTRIDLMLYQIEDAGLRERIFEQIDDIDLILKNTIDYAKQKHLSHPKSTIDLCQIVTEIVQDYQSHNPKRIQISAIYDRYFIHGSQVEIERALTNIINDALKYGSKVRVRLTQYKDTLTIEISDDGPGVPPEQLVNIFLPFQQGDNSSSKGNGLGLSIAKDIIESHGGRIEAKNNQPCGLSITITI